MSEGFAVGFGDMFRQGLTPGWALYLGPTPGTIRNMSRRTFLLFCVPSLPPICQNQLSKVNVPALTSPGAACVSVRLLLQDPVSGAPVTQGEGGGEG